MPESFHDHVIVCGLGKVGYRVVQVFREFGQDVVAIESNERGSFSELVQSQGVPVLIGDARQPELLEGAGVRGCLALVTVTNDDLTNLDVALTARQIRPDVHVVMRVFNDTLSAKLEASFGIRTAFSASAIAAPTFAAAALMRGVYHALHVGDYLLSTIEVQIMPGSELDGQQIGELEQRLNIAVIELYTQGGYDLRSQPAPCLAGGDTIVVVGELHALSELRALNRPRTGSIQPAPRAGLLARLTQRSKRTHAHESVDSARTRGPFQPLRRAWRLLRANLRDADLLLRESIEPLSIFLLVLMLGTLLLHGISNPNTGAEVLPGYRGPGAESGLSWVKAFYTMLMMAAFQPVLALPEQWYLLLIFFLWPIISLILLGRGALSFGLLLLDKRNRREAWDTALATTYHDHMIVCGLSKIGYRTVQEFRELGYEVVAIDREPQGEFNELLRTQSVPVLIGDTRQEKLLRSAGVERCRALVIVSDDDLTNLDTALTARSIRGGLHVVLGVFNEALAHKLDSSFGIRTAFSAPMLAAPTFAAAALMRGVRHALAVRGRLISTIELTIRRDGPLNGRFLRRVEKEQDVSAITLRTESGAGDLRPQPDYRLATDDTIIFAGELTALSELRDLNQQSDDDPMGARRSTVLLRLRRNATAAADD